MVDAYRKTDLWKNSLGKVDDDYADELRKLNAAYNDFRLKASQLTAQITRSLPGLTVHDITHLDALWETADLIVGREYPLNPIEAFVLGGAILLHDSALSFEAFENGQAGLRATIQWKDAIASIRERNPEIQEDDAKNVADFDTLRALHGNQAAALAEKAWRHPAGGEIHLIEDGELRGQYGNLIGQIAASHSWPIEKLELLGNQINAPGSFPIDWRVDPIKIACILRCADAAHLDGRRAPDFLYALMRRSGVSAEHWKAQSWLARVDIDQSDPKSQSLLFTSNRTFGVQDAAAWWVVYDAVSLLSAEIQSSNALLEGRPLARVSPAFKVKSVAGANDPVILQKTVRTNGWQPGLAHIHVSNIERLVKNLGGSQLYGEGNQFGVALRELIQNARDAIGARREHDAGFVGKIVVRHRIEGNGDHLLTIEDDGVGMSERVLTGPLLDFGTSFWISNLVQEEFPGLKSSNFRPVGQFGIGFYSVFMVASSVTVSSRKWNDGLGDVRTLDFPRGLTLRPIVSSGRPDDFRSAASTVVTLRLPSDLIATDGLVVSSGRLDITDFKVSLPDYLACLVCGLDVDIEFDGDTQALIHKSIGAVTDVNDRLRWLEKLSFNNHFRNDETKMEGTARRLRYLDPSHPEFGLATISSSVNGQMAFISSRTVGGLSTSVNARGEDVFAGFIDYVANSAKREAKAEPVVSKDGLARWAEEQILLYREEKPDDVQWTAITSNLCDLGLDPSDVFRAIFHVSGQDVVLNLEEVLTLAKIKGIAVFEGPIKDHIDTWATSSNFGDYPTFRPLKNGSFLSLGQENGIAINPNSLLGCLQRYALARGLVIKAEKHTNVAASMLGTAHAIVFRAHDT